jgi:NUMOD4 motif
MQNEIWMPISGYDNGFYDGLYEISNYGRFKMLPRILKCKYGQRLTKEKIVLGSNSNGYRRVTLKKEGKRKQIDIHILVARAFIPNPDNLPEVNHIFGVRHDNRVSQLEWVSKSGQAKHAFEFGLSVATKGSERSTAKLNEDKVREIKKLYSEGGYSFAKLAKKYLVGKTAIQNIINGKKWKHVV